MQLQLTALLEQCRYNITNSLEQGPIHILTETQLIDLKQNSAFSKLLTVMVYERKDRLMKMFMLLG